MLVRRSFVRIVFLFLRPVTVSVWHKEVSDHAESHDREEYQWIFEELRRVDRESKYKSETDRHHGDHMDTVFHMCEMRG